VDVAVVDPMGRKDAIKPMVARKTDDNWYVEYTPLMEGLHSVNIFFAGKPIPNSPYPVSVSRGKDFIDFHINSLVSFVFFIPYVFICIFTEFFFVVFICYIFLYPSVSVAI